MIPTIIHLVIWERNNLFATTLYGCYLLKLSQAFLLFSSLPSPLWFKTISSPNSRQNDFCYKTFINVQSSWVKLLFILTKISSKIYSNTNLPIINKWEKLLNPMSYAQEDNVIQYFIKRGFFIHLKQIACCRSIIFQFKKI